MEHRSTVLDRRRDRGTLEVRLDERTTFPLSISASICVRERIALRKHSGIAKNMTASERRATSAGSIKVIRISLSVPVFRFLKGSTAVLPEKP